MDRLLVENVRCFYALQRIPIRPLTLLLGENSTGKSTFLALTRMAWDVARAKPSIDFNEEPFLLGAYDQIATWRGGRAGRAKSFTVGQEIRFHHQSLRVRAVSEMPPSVRVFGVFRRQHTQPLMERWVLKADPYEAELSFEPQRYFTLKTPSGEARVHLPPPFGDDLGVESIGSILRYFLTGKVRAPESMVEGTIARDEDADVLSKLFSHAFRSSRRRPYAFAPIRTRPERTYDPLREEPRPEGSHIPMILAKTYAAEPKEWDRLKAAVEKFGAASGLYNGVEVRRMGRKESDPFQIQIRIGTPAFNLVDVGYGVSQVLPIIVDILRNEDSRTYLLQQPEVHLHPRAQAELGSFLAQLTSAQERHFVVETHSDYLVDRVRMEVRDSGGIRARDVLILYFERKAGEVRVQPIELDETGNLRKVPAGYRSFFLEEESRLLGSL